jgi:hypothetical protein
VTEATEAPATESSAESTEAAIAAIRRQLEGQDSISASVVQDGLLDLWGHLPEGESRAIVEHWLTETLERSLYSVTDVDSRLETVLSHQG